MPVIVAVGMPPLQQYVMDGASPTSISRSRVAAHYQVLFAAPAAHYRRRTFPPKHVLRYYYLLGRTCSERQGSIGRDKRKELER